MAIDTLIWGASLVLIVFFVSIVTEMSVFRAKREGKKKRLNINSYRRKQRIIDSMPVFAFLVLCQF